MCMQSGERRFRKLTMVVITYYPEITIIGKILAVWGSIIKHNLGRNLNRSYLKKNAQNPSIRSIYRRNKV